MCRKPRFSRNREKRLFFALISLLVIWGAGAAGYTRQLLAWVQKQGSGWHLAIVKNEKGRWLSRRALKQQLERLFVLFVDATMGRAERMQSQGREPFDHSIFLIAAESKGQEKEYGCSCGDGSGGSEPVETQAPLAGGAAGADEG